MILLRFCRTGNTTSSECFPKSLSTLIVTTAILTGLQTFSRSVKAQPERLWRLNHNRGGPGAGCSSAEGRAGKKRFTACGEARDGGGSYDPHALSRRRACGLIGITRRGFLAGPGRRSNLNHPSRVTYSLRLSMANQKWTELESRNASTAVTGMKHRDDGGRYN